MSGEPTENDLVLRLAESEVGGSASLSSDRTVSVLRAELETLTETLRRPRVENPYLHEAELAQAIRHVDALQDPAVTEFVSSSSPATPPNVEPNEESIGQYRLLGRLGAGGMGTVYRAFHVKLHRTVALKVLSNNPFRSPDVVARFEREMRAIGMLHHPNVVSAVDAGDVNGLHFLVMELVNGLNLSELQQRRGPLPVAEACELIRQAAVGLQYVHSRGLVHRDIKPSNLMLARPSDGHDRPIVKILDLGLALLAPSEERATHELTATGQLMGTIDYMAPEQASDTHLVDIRADIYSLGATLYKLLTGRAPVENDQNNSIMMRLRALGEETPPLVRTFRKDCPPELDALLQRLLSKTPADRPATPQHVAEALAPFARGAELRRLLEENPSPHAVPTNPPPTSRVTASPQRASRRRLWPLAWTAAFFIAAAGLWIGLNYRAVMLLVTGRGELTIEIDDPDIEVIVTQDDAVIHEKTKERRFRVRPVDGQVEFLDPETGAAALSKKFELRRAGDRVSVTVTSQDLERKGADVT
jgi:serine/threonine protein kinase